jgi:hypothetical protein
LRLSIALSFFDYRSKAFVQDSYLIFKKSQGIEYIKGITYYEENEEILKRINRQYSRHGWNHYGSGYFVLDEKTGILKGQGGMGLLWYSVKKYKDFILELDYKCEDKHINSGIFLRVPDIPTSNDYIYHSFEIQINDSGEGIHKTLKPPGFREQKI